MNELALFAGAGGGILGTHGLLGWRTVAAVEIEEYPRAVLLQRQADGILPRFPIWDDVRTFDGKPWRGMVDIITGGFPCQAWSTAASGENTGQNLWPQMLRIIGEICPEYVFSENVDEGAVIMAQKDLAEAGYRTCRGMFAAYHMGADHPRKRWWLVADAYNEGELGGKNNAEMAVKQEGGCRLWNSKPDQPGVSNGMAYRVDRFKATGNGQVPAVAALAWEILSRRIGR